MTSTSSDVVAEEGENGFTSCFKDVVSAETLQLVATQFHFTQPTPVQKSVIPLFLRNKDVAAEAVTGSGKTLAFVIPMIEMLQKVERPWALNQVGAIIMAPTRELATQTHMVVEKFTTWSGYKRSLTSLLLVGGTDVNTNIKKVREEGCNIIVGTPGRIWDLIQRCTGTISPALSLKKLEVLVLDEADTLLDMGFYDTITSLLGALPKQRRTGLFSATQTNEVKSLTRAGLRNPAIVSVKLKHSSYHKPVLKEGTENNQDYSSDVSDEEQKIPESLKNYYVICNEEQKLSALVHFLRERCRQAGKQEKFIVFFLTCGAVDFFARILPLILEMQLLPLGTKSNCWPKNSAYAPLSKYSPSAKKKGVQKDFPIFSLHGKLTAKRRTNTYKAYVESKCGVLLCTDVAARGIDIPDVDWIVQYDPPSNPDFFVHRVGRTARAGREGKSLSFLLPHELDYIELMRAKHVPLHKRSLKFVSSIMETTSSDTCSENERTVSNEDEEATTLRLRWVHSKEWLKKYSRGESASKESGPGAAVRAIINNDPSIADQARSHVDKVIHTCQKAANEMVQKHSSDSDNVLLDVCPLVLFCCLRDRDCLERGTKAFISFIRGYREHDCKFIFRLSKLDLSGTAHSFGLLSFPHMKDFRGTEVNYEGPGIQVDTSVVPYLDKAREKARRERIRKDTEQPTQSREDSDEGSVATTPEKKPFKTTRQAMEEEQKLKRKKRGKQEKMFEEWDDLAAEERLAKKMKKGKVSEEDYEKALFGFTDPHEISKRGVDLHSEEDGHVNRSSNDDARKDKVSLVKQYTKNMKRRDKHGTKSSRKAAVKHGLGVKYTGRKLKLAKKSGKINRKKK